MESPRNDYEHLKFMSGGWSLWIRKDAGDDVCFEDECTKVCTVYSYIELMDAFRDLKSVGEILQLPHDRDVMFFKEDEQPFWEEYNEGEGGKMFINMERSRASQLELEEFEQAWQKLVFALPDVLEKYEALDNIVTGAYLSVRKGQKARVEVWMRDNRDGESTTLLRDVFKALVGEERRIVSQTFS